MVFLIHLVSFYSKYLLDGFKERVEECNSDVMRQRMALTTCSAYHGVNDLHNTSLT